MSSDLLTDGVSGEIKRLSGLSFQPLSFPKELEDRFEADTSAKRSARLWLEGLLAICLFDCFLAADYFGTPTNFWRAVVVRLGIITPLALIVNFSMLWRPGKYFREISITVVSCLAGLTHLYLESNQGAVISAYAQFGIVAVILFANTLMRLQVPYAVGAATLMLLGEWIFLYTDHFLTPQEKILGLSLTLGTITVTVISNYSFCREERLNYLLCLDGDLHVEQLNQSNELLQELAERDALTGLANRHSFEASMQHIWHKALAEGDCVSIILVDVDHFKHVNDTYGHLYGDRVLRRIAHLLAEALRRQDDFAVRFGGEEFIVVLPSTSKAPAALVAERLRKLVEVAGFPALQQHGAPFEKLTATISCGVATAYPAPDSDYEALLQAADQALYQAKENGRNQVISAES